MQSSKLHDYSITCRRGQAERMLCPSEHPWLQRQSVEQGVRNPPQVFVVVIQPANTSGIEF